MDSERDEIRNERAYKDEVAYDPLLKPKSDPASVKKLSFGQDSEDEDENEGLQLTILGNSGASVKRPTVADLPTVTENYQIEVSEKQKHDPKDDNKAVDTKEARLREIRAKIQQLKEQASQGLLNSKTLSERRSGESSEQAGPSRKPTFPESETGSIVPPKKGSREREQETLEKLREFKKRLKGITKVTDDPAVSSSRVTKDEQVNESEMFDELTYLDKIDDDDWLRHKFEAEDEVRLAKDANTKSDDWYSIDDPRSRVHNRSRHRHDDNRHDRRNKSRGHRENLKYRHDNSSHLPI